MREKATPVLLFILIISLIVSVSLNALFLYRQGGTLTVTSPETVTSAVTVVQPTVSTTTQTTMKAIVCPENEIQFTKNFYHLDENASLITKCLYPNTDNATYVILPVLQMESNSSGFIEAMFFFHFGNFSLKYPPAYPLTVPSALVAAPYFNTTTNSVVYSNGTLVASRPNYTMTLRYNVTTLANSSGYYALGEPDSCEFFASDLPLVVGTSSKSSLNDSIFSIFSIVSENMCFGPVLYSSFLVGVSPNIDISYIVIPVSD